MIRKLTIFVVLAATAFFLFLGYASNQPREIKVPVFSHPTQWATVSAYKGRVYIMHNLDVSAGNSSFNKSLEWGTITLMSRRNGPLQVTLLACPFWMPSLLLFASLVTIPGARWVRRRRRLRRGLCPRCAYDLTGNESGRCSECGVAIRYPQAVWVDPWRSAP